MPPRPATPTEFESEEAAFQYEVQRYREAVAAKDAALALYAKRKAEREAATEARRAEQEQVEKELARLSAARAARSVEWPSGRPRVSWCCGRAVWPLRA